MRIHKASEPESITAPAKGVAADSDLGKATAEIKAALAGIPGTLEVEGGAKFGKGSLMVRWVNRENAKPGSLDWHNSPVSVTLWSHDFDASGKATPKVKVEEINRSRVRGKTGPLDVIVKYIIKSIKGLAETIPDDRKVSAKTRRRAGEDIKTVQKSAATARLAKVLTVLERVSTRVAAGPVKFKAEDLKKEFRDIDDATARAIVKLANGAHGNREADAAMQEINDLLGTYGVEAIEMEDAEGVPSYFHNSVAIYCNSGDTYNTTVLYDTVNRTWHLMSYGDFVEDYEQNRGADVD